MTEAAREAQQRIMHHMRTEWYPDGCFPAKDNDVVVDALDRLTDTEQALGLMKIGADQLKSDLSKSREREKKLIEGVWPQCPERPQMHPFPCGRCEDDQSNAPGPCNTYRECWQFWLDEEK